MKNFAANLKCEISHTKLTDLEIPSPRGIPPREISGGGGGGAEGSRKPWKSQSTHTLECKPKLRSESERCANQMATESSKGFHPNACHTLRGSIGGWRRLPKRLGAVTVGDKCH